MDKSYRAVGLMSGTSLDGLDIALCTFNLRQSKWYFTVNRSSTIPYSSEWKKRLIDAPNLDGFSLIQSHKDFGKFLGERINDFLKEDQTNIDLIASHGHTIFHVPEKKMTFQLGDGNSIAAETGHTVVSDFRSLDVALGGQGAPLVPIGDEFLFGNYNFCLNLGGFSNISYNKDGIRVAYDSSPANIILNYLMNSLGEEFDKDGETGRQGNLNEQLFEELNKLEYYKVLPPKSLGREWIEDQLIPILDKYIIPIEDKIRTVCEHIAWQISQPIQDFKKGTILLTGGGAHNKFLVERLKNNTKHTIFLPENQIIDYKEAIIFAFLGVLRLGGENNCLASVTGALRDNMGGAIIVG